MNVVKLLLGLFLITLFFSCSIQDEYISLNDGIDNNRIEVITFGHGKWLGVHDNYAEDNDCIKSTEVSHEEICGLSITENIDSVSFRWKVSAEYQYDGLMFVVDGVVKEVLTGFADWRLVTINLPPGVHTLEWVFLKDESISEGEDCGWLDDIQLGILSSVPATPKVMIPFTQQMKEAVDNTDADLYTSGFEYWQVSTSEFSYGFSSLKSGIISSDQSSEIVLDINITNTNYISFKWKVSSEADYDKLFFTINDFNYGSISGEVDWTDNTFMLLPGHHTLKWIYSKDNLYSSGQDCGWVDQIVINTYEDINTNVSYQVLHEWKMDGDFIDSTGNADGIPFGSPTFVQDRYSIANGAIYFDGINDKIQIPSTPMLSSGTIAFWIKVDEILSSQLYIFSQEGSFDFHTSTGSLAGNPVGFVAVTITETPSKSFSTGFGPEYVGYTPGQWYYVTLTWNNRIVSTYLNGELHFRTVYGLFPGQPSSLFSYFGCHPSGSTAWFKGSLDNVIILDNALSSEQVYALFNE